MATYHIKRSQAKQTSEHGVSSFFEYDLSFQNLAMGISLINGRYPQSGFDVDEGVEQVWYVVSGQGTMQIGASSFDVEEGSMVRVPKREKFWIDGKNLKLVVASSPPWRAEQHKHVEE